MILVSMTNEVKNLCDLSASVMMRLLLISYIIYIFKIIMMAADEQAQSLIRFFKAPFLYIEKNKNILKLPLVV